MEIIPALDLRQGKCVRLYQGDYDKETVFSHEPVAIALRWQAQGAKRLHLIDLDGAAEGRLCNEAAIKEILKAVTLQVQIGGGIRQLETIYKLLSLGASRVILGTAAIEDTELVTEACRRFGESIVIAIDAEDGYVKSHGWRKGSSTTAEQLVNRMADSGVRRFIYTDISRDGTLTEPNFDAIANLVAQTSLPIIASGGISNIAQLKRLAQSGVEGAIVGRALYTGDIDLSEAISSAGRG
jgi:phosphoribosylformimino-5-aminoimidazole carboxamide ribotide isomerase